MRGRFHQRYTVGRELDCTKWKEDYNNCIAFQKSNSVTDAVISLPLESIDKLHCSFGCDSCINFLHMYNYNKSIIMFST